MARRSMFVATVGLCAVAAVVVLTSCTRETVSVQTHRAQRLRLTVFAGAASRPALDEAIAKYEAKTGVKVEATYAGSGTVLAQVVREHTGDLYIPGSDDYMQRAVEQGAVDPGTITALAYLVPSIVVQKGNPKGIKGLEDLAKPGMRVAIAQAGAVCLGDVAEGILRRAGLLEQVRKRVVSYPTSCSEICNLVVLGEVDAIIGWDVFAAQYPDKLDVVALPAELVRVRTIPGAVVKWSRHPSAAKALLDFLASDEGRSCFRKYGYCVEAPASRGGAGGRREAGGEPAGP